MGKIKFGRAFGLALLSALSLMAVFAVSAQATADAGEYYVGEEGKFLLAKAEGTQEEAGKLLVPKRGLTLTCAESTVSKAELETKTQAEGNIEFKGCKAFNHNVEPAKTEELLCSVEEPILAEKVKITPFLHLEAGKVTKLYVTAEPLGTFFTKVTLKDKTANSCAIKNTYEVKGKVSAEVTTNKATVNLITASAAFSELVKDTLTFGAFPATVTAKATVALIDEHAGKVFGVV